MGPCLKNKNGKKGICVMKNRAMNLEVLSIDSENSVKIAEILGKPLTISLSCPYG